MKTNIQKVTSFMKESPVNQLFVMEAIGHYSRECIKSKKSLTEQMKNSIVCGETWVQSAENWKG
jgi:hypothetical protein